jgi:hypothetical protein
VRTSSIIVFSLLCATAGAYEQPTACSDPFRVDEAGLGNPRYFLSAEAGVVPIILGDPIESPTTETPEPYFEARFDSHGRLRTVVVYWDGPDHVLSYEYEGSGVVQHCRPVYRPPPRGTPPGPGGSAR